MANYAELIEERTTTDEGAWFQGLQADTLYGLEVVPVDEDGNEGTPIQATMSTSAAEAPPEPPMAALSERPGVSDTEVAVDWNEVERAHSYTLHIVDQDGQVVDEVAVEAEEPGTEHRHTLTGTTCTLYDVQLVAHNEVADTQATMDAGPWYWRGGGIEPALTVSHVTGEQWTYDRGTRYPAYMAGQVLVEPLGGAVAAHVAVDERGGGGVDEGRLVRVRGPNRLQQGRVAAELVLLVVGLRPVERRVLEDLGRERIVVPLGLCGPRRPGLLALLRRAGEEGGLVLALEGGARRIVGGPEMVEQRLVGTLIGVVRHPHGLDMVAEGVVGRGVGRPARVAHARPDDAVHGPEPRVRTPEAPEGEVRPCQVGRGRPVQRRAVRRGRRGGLGGRGHHGQRRGRETSAASAVSMLIHGTTPRSQNPWQVAPSKPI